MILELVLTVLSSSLAQEPALLPKSLPGWQFERLDFPLSFAPDIGYEGWEELSFAPGMFDAAADDYFSYVLAFKLRGDVDLGPRALEDILTKYYRGLCKAVGEGKGLDYDYDSITAKVEAHDDRYTATIDMVDSFVTLKPLTLNFELIAHPLPRSTELFGVASPAGADSKIWKTLCELRDAWSAARPAPVFLNHLYRVPDQETFDAIRSSEFMRKTFCVSEERETVRRDMSYSGVYFYGEKTYFEFLPPGEGELTQGNSGVAFGVEAKGATAALVAGLKEREIQTFVGPVTREIGGEQVPWFRICGVQMPNAAASLSLFTMEYDEQFLAKWHAGLAPKRGGISRSSVLDRYAAKLDPKGALAASPFVDITEVTLDVEPAQRARFAELCETFGYELERGEAAWTVHAPGMRYVVREATPSRGVTSFKMRLREEVKREPIQMGKARMSFEGNEATFTFDEAR